jgi:hypothetical protein
MTSRDFVYWLQGYFELAPSQALSVEQTELIRRHLSMVFKHEIDPGAGSVEHQAELTALHSGTSPKTSSIGDIRFNC